MNYNHSIILHPYTPTGGVVGIDPVNLHGYWEYKDGTEGGELTFSRSKGRLCLEDYDGSYTLPRAVITALRTWGAQVSTDFE